MPKKEGEEPDCIDQRERKVFEVPKKSRAAQTNHAAHALGSSNGSLHMRQPLSLVRVEQLLVCLPRKYTCDLPAYVGGVVKPRREALRPERRHAVRSVACKCNSVPKHPFGRDAAVERVLYLRCCENQLWACSGVRVMQSEPRE